MENDKFCHECHSLLEPGAKFCVHCGTKTRINKDVEYVASNQSNELFRKEYDKITESNVSIVKNKAQWTLEPGVIARRISASDFENLDNVTGINIQQGVTAYIYIDGILTAQLNGGLYNFVTNEAIDRILEQKATPGLSGHIRKAFNSVIKAITGKRVKEVIDENKEDFSSIKTYDDVIRRLQPKSTIEVYLKADSPFNVVLGIDDNINGSVGFKPISVRCKRLTANVAVSIQLTITEFSRFITNFLVSTNLVTCSDIARYMDADVRGIVMNQLRDVEIDEYGIPEDVVQRIKSMFTTHINVPGATITHIREVTSVNSDINRLREIADQLYIEEKELDYAIRSNEFQNRLAGVENAKKIQEAQTALELHKQLSEINKDNTLYENELDSFYMLLSRQKKIREAKSEQELQKALREIAKLDLIDQYDLETLTTDLISKKVDRDAVAEIMAMQSMANIELKRISLEEAIAGQRHILSKVNQRNSHELKRDDLINNIELDDISTEHIHKKSKKNIENEGEILDLKLTHKKKVDEYQDNRYHEELKLAKAKADLEFEEEERKERLKAEKLAKLQRMNMDMFQMWADEDERKEQNAHHRKIEEKTIDYGHAETMADKMAAHQQALKDREIELRKVGSTMSAEQLLAEQASKLDAAAQSKLAESFGDSRAYEIERRLNQNALEEAKAREKLIREEAERREQALREDQKKFFDQLSSDRDSMMKNVMGMMGMVVNAKSQADQHSQEVEHLRTHINYTDRENAIRREEYERTHQRLLHEEQRNDHTYSKVLAHEEKIQEAAVDMATRTRSYLDEPKTICPNCGKEVPLKKFCKECGDELEIVLNRK